MAMYSESPNVVRNERGQVLTWFFIIVAIAAQSQLAGAQQRELPAADWSRVVPVGARVRVLDAAGHLIEGDIGARSDSVHGDTGSSPGLGGKPSRFENVSVGALFGAGIGWGLGHFVFARARWQQVHLR